MAEPSGHVALVTGASRGIGRAIALRLAQDGHKVVVGYSSSPDQACEVVAEITKMNGEGSAVAVQSDLGRWEDGKFLGAEKLFEEAIAAFEFVDILVNNAGLQRDQIFLRMTEEEIMEVMLVDLLGPSWLSRLMLKQVTRRRWGRVINITSLIKDAGNKGQANYAMAKGGMSGLTKALAREFGSRDITVNEVSPGLIETDATKKLEQMPGAIDWFLDRQSIGRKGQPEDVAGIVSFLASDEASFITGACIPVNGGF